MPGSVPLSLHPAIMARANAIVTTVDIVLKFFILLWFKSPRSKPGGTSGLFFNYSVVADNLIVAVDPQNINPVFQATDVNLAKVACLTDHFLSGNIHNLDKIDFFLPVQTP